MLEGDSSKEMATNPEKQQSTPSTPQMRSTTSQRGNGSMDNASGTTTAASTCYSIYNPYHWRQRLEPCQNPKCHV